MIDIESFRSLVGRRINRFFIILWPPLGEDKMLDVDISVGFEFEENEGSIIQVGIDKDDNWTPLISRIKEAKEFEWSVFESRINDWMKGEINDSVNLEYYDASFDHRFNRVLHSDILDIEFLTLKDKFNPFGVRFLFTDEYIVLSPISDGTTFETSKFNMLGNIENYEKMGEIDCVSINSIAP